MAFALSTDGSLEDAVRDVVTEQLARAVAELRGETDESRDEQVHAARKRCKRIRAALRMVRDHIGHDAYRRENVAVRDAARTLSGVRDAQVLIETLDDVVDRAGDDLDADAVAPVRAALRDAHARLRARVVDSGTAADEAIAALTDVAARSRRWPLAGVTIEALRPGIERVYQRGRDRMADAYDDPAPERFHEWRKRAKYLWHHVELLEPAWPGPLEALADEIHELSNLLGDEHDRTVLGEELSRRPSLVPDPDVAQALALAIDAQRRALRQAARPLGERVYAETAAQFSARAATYWHAAHTPAVAMAS